MANDGTLSVDSSKLDSALVNNFPDFQNFFQATGASQGFAYNFSADLSTVNDSTNGIVALNLTEITSTQAMLTKTINVFEDHLADRQKFLITQYSQVDAMLRLFPLIQQQITDQLASIRTG
jgi:flagellar hook-associated protein 2